MCVGSHLDPVSTVSTCVSTGPNAFRLCRRHVTDMLLVSDEEILACVSHLYHRGLVVEPAGAAAFAALFHDKVPDVSGKRVVVVITGGNISSEEMALHVT